MKKIMIGAVLSGGLVMGGYGHTVEASTTDVNANVTAGETTFTVDQTLDFGEQSLAEKIVFPQKSINYNVVDYSGNDKGYTVNVAITASNEHAKLAIQGVQLSPVASEVINAASLAFGENPNVFTADLELSGVQEISNYSETITWSFQKATGEVAE